MAWSDALGQRSLRRLAMPAAALLLGIATLAAAAADTAPTKALFKPGIYRGHLGTRAIEAELNLDPEVPDTLAGRYRVDGEASAILLAGEVDGEDLYLEESRNGVDISGVWYGKISGARLTGEWSDPDDSTRIAFDLSLTNASRPRKP